MMFGFDTLFKCDDCQNEFFAPAMEWCATIFLAPMLCPQCGCCHTYPKYSLGGQRVYKKIWETMDSKG